MNNYYVAIEANEHLDIVDEELTLFEALCQYHIYENCVDNEEEHPIFGDLQDTDEIEIGEIIDGEMNPIDSVTYEEDEEEQ